MRYANPSEEFKLGYRTAHWDYKYEMNTCAYLQTAACVGDRPNRQEFVFSKKIYIFGMELQKTLL